MRTNDPQPSQWSSRASRAYDSLTKKIQLRNAQIIVATVGDSEDPPRRIYEIGCGTGALTQLIVEKWPDADVHASDISPAMIDTAKSKPELKSVTFTRCSFLEAATESATYDMLLSNAALHWMHPHYLQVFQTINRLLRPGGVLCGSMAGRTSATDEFDQFVAQRVVRHENETQFTKRRATPAQVRRLAQGAGLIPEDVYLLERHEEMARLDFISWMNVSGGREPQDGLTAPLIRGLGDVVNVVHASVMMLLRKPDEL